MGGEKEIQKEIMDALRGHPKVGYVWQNDSNRTIGRKYGAGKYKPAGLPDICGFLNGGTAFFIEVKTREGRLSESQADFITRAQNAKARAGVARSRDEALLLLAEW